MNLLVNEPTRRPAQPLCPLDARPTVSTTLGQT